MSKKVLFTAMEHGTQADYDLVLAHDAANAAQQADRVLGWLQAMDGDSPYQTAASIIACRPRPGRNRTGPTTRPLPVPYCTILAISLRRPIIRRSRRRFWRPMSVKRTTGSSNTTVCFRGIIGFITTRWTVTHATGIAIMNTIMLASSSALAGISPRSTQSTIHAHWSTSRHLSTNSLRKIQDPSSNATT